MNLEDVSEALLPIMCVVAWIVFLWRVGQAVSQPDRRGTRLLATFVGLLALEYTLSIAGDDIIGRILDPVLRTSRSNLLLSNVILIAAYATMISFLWYIASRSRRTQIFVQHLPAAAAVAVILVAWYSSAPEQHGLKYDTPGLPVTMATFWVAAALYLGFGSLLIGYLAWTGVAESDRLTRRCYRITALGMFGCVIGIGIARVLAAVLSALRVRLFPWFADATDVVVRISVVLIVVGLVVPAVVSRTTALRVLMRHFWFELKIRPLWRDLGRVFPEHALPVSARSPVGMLLRPRTVHEQFYRRLVECRDGLLALSALAATKMPTEGEQATREAVAVALALALDEGCASAHAADGPGPVIAKPNGSSADDDARALATLSDQLLIVQAGNGEKASSRFTPPRHISEH